VQLPALSWRSWRRFGSYTSDTASYTSDTGLRERA
jgi:hypothetical protein